jgi:hypothetical protein
MSAKSAVQMLQEVTDAIRALDDVPLVTNVDLSDPENTPHVMKGRHPILCRILLDLNRAALIVGDAQIIRGTLDDLDELATEHFPGFCPHYYLAYAQCLLTRGGGDPRAFAADLIRKAREMGEVSKNPWVPQEADYLERQIGPGP